MTAKSFAGSLLAFCYNYGIGCLPSRTLRYTFLALLVSSLWARDRGANGVQISQWPQD
jgi:hypothetical protein